MSEPAAASPVVSVATNADGWFTAVSPGFLALIAQPVEALAGVNVVDLVHPLDAAGARGLIAAASVGPVATLRFLTANDEWSPMRVRTTLLPDGRINFALAPLAVPPAPGSESAPGTASRGSESAPGGEIAPGTASRGGEIAPGSESAPSGEIAPGSEIAPGTAALGGGEGLPGTASRGSEIAPGTAARAATVSGDFPYADSEEHMDYVASRPSIDVAADRAAAREAATAEGATAMLEVDTGGRTVFVGGDWRALIATSEQAEDPAPALFEQLLASTGQGELVLGHVHQAIQPGEANNAVVQLDGNGLRRVRVEPIPSPLLAGVSHALVSVAPAPAGATVSAVGDPSWSAAAVLKSADEGAEVASPAEAGGEATTAQPDLDESIGEIESEPKRRRLWMWLVLAALVLVAAWALFGRSNDAASEMGPIDIEVVAAEPVEVEPGQTWRPLGVSGLSDLHGVAATNDGAVVASLTGRIVRVDGAGLAQSMVVVGDPALTALSDVASVGDGTTWALDAGLAQIYRVAPDGEVTILEPNYDPLRNARGIALGSDDTVWVASTASSQLVQIGRDGGIVANLPQPGRQPSDVIELDDGTLWYVDAELIELVHVSATGETLSTLPIESFFSNEAPHLAVIGDVLWVTEPAQGSVFAVDLMTDQPTGERISLIRPEGERVERPIGLTADAAGRLWTVDSVGRAAIILDN